MFLLIRITLLALVLGCVLAADTEIAASNPSKPIWNNTYLDNLRRDLLATYDTNSRPSFGRKNNVTVGLTVIHLELDEDAGVLSSSVWIRMDWEDPKMQWNPSQYGNVSVIRLNYDELWKPDVTVYNSARANRLDYYGGTNLLVRNNGSVLWVPPARLKTNCAVDLHRWPLDTQHCIIKMGSWTYDANEIDLLVSSLDLSEYSQLNDWRVVNKSEERNVKYYPCCPEPYVDVTFQITLKRQSGIYGPVVLAPVVAVVLLSLVVFWMPLASGQKLLVNAVNIVVIIGYLLYFVQRWPTIGGNNTPYIVCFYSKALYLSVISIIVAVVVRKLSRPRQANCLPWLLRSSLDGWLGSVLLLNWLNVDTSEVGQLARKEDHEAGVFEDCLAEDQRIIQARLNGNSEKNGTAGISKFSQNLRYYVLLAAAINRIVFVVFAVLFALMACTYVVCL